MPGIVIKTLTKRYGEVAAVEGLSLDVKPGELVSLLGPSGCGKTTTLRLVAGFLQPEAGEIWVGERCLSSPTSVVPPERRRMAMIFQSYVLWPHMTVAQNVAYGLRFKAGVSRVDRDRRAADMLRTVQLAGFESRYPGELSGGQQQRVAVARALVVEPEILLLDEPLSNLDANLREEMRFEIRRLSRICIRLPKQPLIGVCGRWRNCTASVRRRCTGSGMPTGCSPIEIEPSSFPKINSSSRNLMMWWACT